MAARVRNLYNLEWQIFITTSHMNYFDPRQNKQKLSNVICHLFAIIVSPEIKLLKHNSYPANYHTAVNLFVA